MFEKSKEKKFTKIFFATDVHGSERAFRKFLSAGKYYNADVVMLCGDLTGKMLVPITNGANGVYVSNLYGQEHKARTKEELIALKEKISNGGFYPCEVDERAALELQVDPKKADEKLNSLMIERLERWIQLAEEHYKYSGIKCVITGGNDDPSNIEPVLSRSDYVINSDMNVVWLDEFHEALTVGHANMTPWQCPRDVSEDTLGEMIEKLVEKLENVENAIFVLHAPPLDSRLDTAAKLDATVYPPSIVTQAGQPVMIGVGSKAVRESIEKNQPVLSLHGHIHESRGAVKIGRTLCLNPGSEYSEGVLRGVIVNISRTKILSYQLTSG